MLWHTLISRVAIGAAILAANAMLVTGCGPTDVDVAIEDPTASFPVAPGDGSVRPIGGDAIGNNGVEDGTSNTIAVGEPGSERNTSDPAPVTGAQPGAGADNAALLSFLGDKFLEFGSSSFFSSGSITENSELVLCAFGRFGMRITRVTSTSLDTFSSEDTLAGTWTAATGRGGTLLVLNVEDASDPADLGRKEFQLTDDGSTLLVDGNAAQISDAGADCAAAQQ